MNNITRTEHVSNNEVLRKMETKKRHFKEIAEIYETMRKDGFDNLTLKGHIDGEKETYLKACVNGWSGSERDIKKTNISKSNK